MESLQSFVMVCEEKSVSEAAEKLFVSKQALSTTIRKLEEEVNAALFVRSRRGMELTMEGEVLYAKAAKMLELWEGTKREIKAVCNAKNTRLNVGFSMMSIAYWNKELEERFGRENPLIDLKTENDISANLRGRLNQREIDVMVTGTKTEEPECYTRILLRKHDAYLIMNENDPLASLERITPLDLQKRHLCFFSGNEWHMNAINRYFRDRGIDVECAALPENSYVVNIYKAAAQNAILVVSGILRLFFGEIKGFVIKKLEVQEDEAFPEYGVYAMMLREREGEEKIMRFVDFLYSKLPLNENE